MSAAEDFALTSPVAVGGRESHDHFPTPRWVTAWLLAHHRPPQGALILDPSCGEGELLDVLREAGCRTMGYELDEGRAAEATRRGHPVEVGDALARPWSPEADAIVMNPPYGSEAGRFVQQALTWSWQTGGRVCALLYLSFLEPSGERGDLFRRCPPSIYVLPRRPKFDGKGTNATGSAWFCWPGDGRIRWPR